jgi:general secretion pathway protein I
VTAWGLERRRGGGRAGFTLVEMMLALAVLAFSLATLMTTQASTVRMMGLADEMQVAAILLRAQMQALEEELRTEGFQDSILTSRGDFRRDGFDAYEWEAIIEPVEVTDDAEDQFVANIHAELFGEGMTGEGSLTGAAAVSQFLPMIIGQVPEFINQVGQRTRKITLTITWDSRMGLMALTANQFYTVLDLEEAGMGSAAPVVDDATLMIPSGGGGNRGGRR